MINEMALRRARARGKTHYAVWVAVVNCVTDQRWREMNDSLIERDRVIARLRAL